MANSGEPVPKKRKGFVFTPVVKPDRQVTIPLYKQLKPSLGAAAPPLPAPPAVQAMFGQEDEIIAIDCETHALVPPRPKAPWRKGRFGLMTMLDDEGVSPLRVVQLGWAMGTLASAEPIVKARLIKPDGFQIDDRATAKHRIAHGHAQDQGLPARAALEELCADVFDLCERGGRVVGHHLEFDATLIAQELQRAGMVELLQRWEACVKNGLCTMNPHIGQWVRAQAGGAIHNSDVTQRIPVRLSDAVATMLPDGTKLLQNHHDAGRDAAMHWLLYRELARRAKL